MLTKKAAKKRFEVCPGKSSNSVQNKQEVRGDLSVCVLLKSPLRLNQNKELE